MRARSCGVLVFLFAAAVGGAGAGPGAGAQVVHLPFYPFNGDSSSDFFGASVSGAGDVNGDGFDDVIVGAWAGESDVVTSGGARVFSGADGAILHNLYGDSTGDRFGFSARGAGDVNNDGFDDVIVGAYRDDNNGSDSGSARVFSGANGAILHTFNGDSAGDWFGFSVDGAGDVNGDGFDDVIVGANRDSNMGVFSGSARVFSGATGAILYTFDGEAASDEFGFSVGGAGDVNDDGSDDLIVGAPNDNTNGADSGRVRVFSGATGAVLHTFNGDALDDRLGSAVSGAGDVNGDGFDDLIAGAHLDDNNGEAYGSARVFSGADGAILHTFDGDSISGQFGESVSGAGDVNGDGFDDLIVGAHLDDNNGADSGSARVFCGATGAVLYTFDGAATNDFFGTSVSGAGDVNGDGFDDLIVGAEGDDNNGNGSGSARVFFSFALPAPPKPCPGDVDGDGDVDFADLNLVISNFNMGCAP